MLDTDVAVEAGRQVLLLAAELALPVLLAGTAVALAMGILEAATQIQDSMLSLVPKLLAMAGTAFVLLPWFLETVVDYLRDTLLALGGPPPFF
jgi:flagellar biosynthetic protein FliQ